MSNTTKNYIGTAADEDIIEVLTAISVVSRRLARNIAAVSQQSQTKEGGKQNEQNERYGCNHRRTAQCCCSYYRCCQLVD